MGIYKLSSAGSFATSRTYYKSMLAGNTAFSPTSFESIATVTVGSGGSSYVEFTSIPSTYNHLQIRWLARDARATTADGMSIRYNSDTSTANYVLWHYLNGDGASATASGLGSGYDAQNFLGNIPSANASASQFAVGVTDILDYANTNKYKVQRTLSGYDRNGAGEIYLVSGMWMSTSAISTIRIFGNNGNLVEYSHFALYGIKGA